MNILIIYGGQSCEHDISIITACLAKGYFDGQIISGYLDKQNRCFLVPNNLTPSKHMELKLNQQLLFCFGERRVAVCKGKKIKKYLNVDVVVNCCHGVCGEDGTIAGVCQLLDVPLVGSNMLSSAIAMDKIATKQALRTIGMPTVAGKRITLEQYQNSTYSTGNLGYPVIVKPNKLGSSIGITLCRDKLQLKQALEVAFRYDNVVLCEKALTDFYEINCSAMRVDGVVQTSEVDVPITANDLLTFEDKYVANGKSKLPTVTNDIDSDIVATVKRMTEQIYQQLGFSGVIRVDYLVDKTKNKIYVNEINSIPGSLAYGLWSKNYLAKTFGNILIAQAVADYQQNAGLEHTFTSSVLSGGINKK